MFIISMDQKTGVCACDQKQPKADSDCVYMHMDMDMDHVNTIDSFILNVALSNSDMRVNL